MWKMSGALSAVGLLVLFIPVRAAEEAKPGDIVARAIEAQGGLKTMKKFKGFVSKSKGKYYGNGEGIEFTGESSLHLPNRVRTEIQAKVGDQDFTFVSIYDGKKGWIKLGDNTEEMDKDKLAEAREQMNVANITQLVCLRDKDYQLSPLGEVKVGDLAAIGIRVERKGYREVSLFFDKKSGYLLQVETRVKDQMQGGQEYTSTTRYEEYKKVEGMMVPHKITIQRDGKPYVDSVESEVKLSEKLDDSVFEKP